MAPATYCCARAAASGSVRPTARLAAIAAANVHPVPCVPPVSMRRVLISWNSSSSSSRRSTISSPAAGAWPPVMTTAFFFSSRSRHTRFSRDWSSDVCSSDLGRRARARARRGAALPRHLGVQHRGRPRGGATRRPHPPAHPGAIRARLPTVDHLISERTLPADGHLRHDQPVVGARLERETLRHTVDHDLLEQLEPGLLLVDDPRRLGVEPLALGRVERVARLLHELVEALARLVAGPVLAAEAVRVEQTPERAVGVEEGGLRIDEQQAVGL